MTFTEILTIYLAIGAPFGVYYYFKHRDRLAGFPLAAKTFLAALFWFYYAGQLVRHKFVSFQITQQRDAADVSREKQIESVSQNLQTAFTAFADFAKPTFFEFREVLERYIGLTLAVQNSAADAPVPTHETEVFRIAGHEKRELQLAGRIMHRRNFLRLQTHSAAARQDFLRVCIELHENIVFNQEKLNGKLEAWDSYHNYAAQLAALLDDSDAIKALRRMTDAAKPAADKNGTRERAIWKTLQPSPTLSTLHPKVAASAQAMPTSRLD